MAIGIDEVGRGCWAGPLLIVAAKQIGVLPSGLADSKILSKIQRVKLSHLIQRSCRLGLGWVSPAEIDSVGLTKAMFLGVERALIALDSNSSELIIIDGNINYCPPRFMNVRTIIKADSSHPIVCAASIYAKVLRDNYMNGVAPQFPQYYFERHVGYGTKLHMAMLAEHGPSEIHRKSYKPIRALL